LFLFAIFRRLTDASEESFVPQSLQVRLLPSYFRMSVSRHLKLPHRSIGDKMVEQLGLDGGCWWLN